MNGGSKSTLPHALIFQTFIALVAQFPHDVESELHQKSIVAPPRSSQLPINMSSPSCRNEGGVLYRAQELAIGMFIFWGWSLTNTCADPVAHLGGRLLRNLPSCEKGCASDPSSLISAPRKNALELCPTAGLEETVR